MTTAIKRTYSARSKSTASSSSLSRVPPKRWRNDDGADAENAPPTPQKRRRLSSSDPKMKLLPTTSTCNGKQPQQKTLTQLHFVLESSVLRTCSLCGLSYTKGAPDDEVLHRSHCGRVQRGMEWGREEEKESFRAGVTEVATNVTLKNGSRGRIICFPANIGGRIGSKLANLLEMINLTLASPPLTESVQRCSKAYLFLVPSLTNTQREKIVGCVIAQRISTAMAVASPDSTASCKAESAGGRIVLESSPRTAKSAPWFSTQQHHQCTPLVAVDASSGLFCYPQALPTPLGIPRLFVSSMHRRQGIATQLLTAAAQTFIHGCPLDPLKGDVAFTQPTAGGNAVMRSWGKGFVRIYQD